MFRQYKINSSVHVCPLDRPGVCVRALTHTISLLREAIFLPYHSNLDKEDARPLCFTSTHAAAAKEQSPPQRVNERGKQIDKCMNGLLVKAGLYSCVDRKEQISDHSTHLIQPHTIRTDDDECSEVA